MRISTQIVKEQSALVQIEAQQSGVVLHTGFFQGIPARRLKDADASAVFKLLESGERRVAHAVPVSQFTAGRGQLLGLQLLGGVLNIACDIRGLLSRLKTVL